MADTHRLHREVQVPDGDILIHAGDVCHAGQSLQTLIDFNEWIGELPHSLKIVVPGNHDVPLEADPAARRLLTNATLLINDGIEFFGLRIWGTPVTVSTGGAFGMWYAPDRRRLFARVPEDTDVLISHGPAKGILDSAPEGGYHAGDPELLLAVRRVQPKLVICGHIHPGHGVKNIGEMACVNASLLGEGGGIEREPIVLRISRR